MMLMTVLIVFYVVTYFKQKLIFMGIVLFLGDFKKKSIFHLMFTLLNKCFINVKNINGFFIVKKIGCE